MMKNRLPNLLIIGAMKSGTSSLHDYLGKHPDIFMSTPKEIHFYADNVYTVRDKSWYSSFFKTDKKIAGTTPQSYTKCHNKYYQNIPKRIYEDTPDVKLIYIVRDPVERYASHILESYHCDKPSDIKYSQESGNYLKTSMYGMQLTAYLEYFKKSQIHVVSLEELQSNRLEELNKIFSFLGVTLLNDETLFDFKTNMAQSKSIPRIVKHSLFIRAISKFSMTFGERIAFLVSELFYSHQLKKPDLSEQEKSEVRHKLHEDIKQFRELTGKPFDEWEI